MTNKQKLLDALGCALDEINEDRLIDILVDAYKAKKQRIVELESANCLERQRLHDERNSLLDERRRMREDPTYWVHSRYCFNHNGKGFFVMIDGPRVSLYESLGNADIIAQPVPPTF